MNLHELVKWGRETLALIDDPCRLEAVPFKVSMERVRAKLGWLVEFREALAEWSQWHEVNEAALNFVWCQCLYVGAGVDMAAALPAVSASTVIELREELIRFVTVESSKVADRRALARDDRGAGILLRKAQGVRGWTIQERLYRAGAQPRGDCLEADN